MGNQRKVLITYTIPNILNSILHYIEITIISNNLRMAQNNIAPKVYFLEVSRYIIDKNVLILVTKCHFMKFSTHMKDWLH